MVLAGLGLAACGAEAPVSNPGSEGDRPSVIAGLFARKEASGAAGAPTRPELPAPLAQVALVGGDVVVRGPAGYCIDPTTVRQQAQRGFALIASCRILSGGKTGDPVPPVLTTVTAGPLADGADLPSPAALAASADAPLLGGETAADFVAAHVGAGGDSLLSGGDKRHWRAAFRQNGRLVGLALYAPKGSPLAGADGAAMLSEVRASIAAASARPGDEGAGQDADTGKRGGGLLGRLFNRQDLP